MNHLSEPDGGEAFCGQCIASTTLACIVVFVLTVLVVG